MAEGPDPLETWSVATFDVVAFGLVGVLAGHASGGLADVLPGIGTVPGVLAFGYLWVLAVVATRWVLPSDGLDEALEDGFPPLVARAAGGGAFVGASFVLGAILVGGLSAALSGGGNLPALAYVGLLGAAIGAIVGAVVGAVFALVNVGLARSADLLLAR